MPINCGAIDVIIHLCMLKWIDLIGDFHVQMSLTLSEFEAPWAQNQMWQYKNGIISAMFEGSCQTLGHLKNQTLTVPLVEFGELGSNFRLFTPLVSLRSCLRIGKYSTVMLNVQANGVLKIAREHTVCYTWAKYALLFHFTSFCPQFWSVILYGGHRYNQGKICPGRCTGKQSRLRHLSNCRLCFSAVI